MPVAAAHRRASTTTRMLPLRVLLLPQMPLRQRCAPRRRLLRRQSAVWPRPRAAARRAAPSETSSPLPCFRKPSSAHKGVGGRSVKGEGGSYEMMLMMLVWCCCGKTRSNECCVVSRGTAERYIHSQTVFLCLLLTLRAVVFVRVDKKTPLCDTPRSFFLLCTRVPRPLPPPVLQAHPIARAARPPSVASRNVALTDLLAGVGLASYVSSLSTIVGQKNARAPPLLGGATQRIASLLKPG